MLEGFTKDKTRKGAFASYDPYKVGINERTMYIRSEVKKAFNVDGFKAADVLYSNDKSKIAVILKDDGDRKLGFINRGNQATLVIKSTLKKMGITLGDQKLECNVEPLPDGASGFIVMLPTQTTGETYERSTGAESTNAQPAGAGPEASTAEAAAPSESAEAGQAAAA